MYLKMRGNMKNPNKKLKMLKIEIIDLQQGGKAIKDITLKLSNISLLITNQ